MLRSDWMGVLARAPVELLETGCEAIGSAPGTTWLRVPEIGMVMVRGRAGGSGAPFNAGEMTVTRCSLRLPTGEVGHAYVAGRDRRKAELAALCDALMQTDARPAVEEAVLDPARLAEAEAARSLAGKAAATKVDFFTMVRGE